MKAHWCNFRRDSGYVRLTPDDGWLFLLLFNSYHPRQSISIALGMQRRKMINTDPWGMLCVWSRLRENEEGHSRWGARRTKRVLVPPQRLPFLQKQECLCRNHRIFEIWPPPQAQQNQMVSEIPWEWRKKWNKLWFKTCDYWKEILRDGNWMADMVGCHQRSVWYLERSV